MIGDKKQLSKARIRQLYPLVFLLSGIVGMLSLFLGIPGLSWNPLAVFLFGAALPAVWWLLYCRKHPRILAASILIFLGAGTAFWFFDPSLATQLQEIAGGILGRPLSENPEVTGGMLLIAGGIALLFFLLEILLRTHWPVYFLTTAVLLAAPLMGISPGFWSGMGLAVFQAAFWSMRGLQRQKQNKGEAVRKICSMAALGMAGCFLVSILAVGLFPEWFYHTASTAEGFLQCSLKQISGDSWKPADGIINRGNLYPAGIQELELWTNNQPTETLYLKEFSGGDYAGGVWQPADEEAVFARMEENSLHWEEWESWIPGMYASMPYITSAAAFREDPPPERILYIMDPSESSGGILPYYAMRQGFRRERGEPGYTVRYFQSDEVAGDWANTSSSLDQARDWYAELQDAYARETGIYTAVPETELPRLTELCAENPKESLEEITAFIFSVLDQAVYTTTPGVIPVNQDPNEYFLFESQAGYCQHFASAAVLMYRLYGIPARYAAGYAVSPDSFELQEDGGYTAVVTDEDAHAWPEIYLDGYGWTPVEVTPSASLPAMAYPGLSFSELERMLDGEIRLPELQSHSEREILTVENGGLELPEISEFQIEPAWIMFLLLVCFGLYLIYRESTRRSLDTMDVRQLFGRMLAAVHNAGLLKGYDGSEGDFPKRLSEELNLPVPLMETAVSVVKRAAYGNRELTAEETAAVQMSYQKVIRALGKRLPWYKKLWFRYILIYDENSFHLNEDQPSS